MKVAIIGGGLAGTACAYILKQNGLEPVIYERGNGLAGGASGNDTGLYNPRLSAERSPESEYFTAAYMLALRTFPLLENIAWNPCGALHLMNDEKKQKRFPQTLKNWNWLQTHMRMVSAGEASDIAGVALTHDALYLPQSGTVSPVKLCAVYAQDVPVHFNTEIKDPESLQEDAVIIACGAGAAPFASSLRPVRGQITQVSATAESKNLKCALCYGGYTTPAINGIHTIGATFQRWLDHSDILPEDDADNIEKLRAVAPLLAKDMKITHHRASVRATSPDHFPLVGRIPSNKNIFISAGHGSHGILSSLMAAHLLADIILDRSRCLPSSVIARLDPVRCVEMSD